MRERLLPLCKRRETSFPGFLWVGRFLQLDQQRQYCGSSAPAIVKARKQFRWRVVGVAPNKDLRFEIHNGSAMTLPYLSVGVRGKLRPPKHGPLNGRVFLPVGPIRPGETKVVEFGCYKKLISPEDTEAFALPDPGPEDREQYWEFRTYA